MATKIPWTDETWNPVVGCSKVSEGCQNCYAERMMYRQVVMGAARHGKNPDGNEDAWIAYSGVMDEDTHGWNGEVSLRYDQLDKPLHWHKPRMIFVCSMSDLFHPSVPFEFIDKVFEIMVQCPQHTFQVLTKRIKRAAKYLPITPSWVGWPKHFWLGVTAENQRCWDERKEDFLAIPAAVHFVCNEPCLGEIIYTDEELKQISQIIVGGESGPKRRECKIEWVRSIVEQCQAADVPVFVKQVHLWGVNWDSRRFETEDRMFLSLTEECTPKMYLSKDMSEWPEDLRLREYPK